MGVNFNGLENPAESAKASQKPQTLWGCIKHHFQAKRQARNFTASEAKTARWHRALLHEKWLHYETEDYCFETKYCWDWCTNVQCWHRITISLASHVQNGGRHMSARFRQQDKGGLTCVLTVKYMPARRGLAAGEEGFVREEMGDGVVRREHGEVWRSVAVERLCTIRCVKCGEENGFLARTRAVEGHPGREEGWYIERETPY